MPLKPTPCPSCGVLRHIAGNAPVGRVCWACHLAGLGNSQNPKRPKPKPHQQFTVVSPRAATQPLSSWWAEKPQPWGRGVVTARAKFAWNLRAERSRLHLIGAGVPKQQFD